MTTTTTPNIETTTETIVEVQQQLQLINVEDKLTLKLLSEKINEIITHLNSNKVSNTTTRDRGPKSEKDMTESDARKILLGEMKDVSHTECASKLGLSYGQVYSARKGFTFKNVYKEFRDSQAK